MFVDTVDVKIKACNALNAIFVDTVNTGICWLLHNTVYRVIICENSTLHTVSSCPSRMEGYLNFEKPPIL